MGLPLAPQAGRLLDSTFSGYYRGSSSDDLNDNILHPDQFDVDTWWTFDAIGGDTHCLIEFTEFQRGPYIELNSPAASGQLPTGDDYLMRPSHLVSEVGVPVMLNGDPVTTTLAIDVNAYDRDPGGQIREVALWVEGPENEEDGHTPDRNLLRGGTWSQQRDWYYLTSAPYEVTFDLSGRAWPDGSYVISGTHYLYVRAMDRDNEPALHPSGGAVPTGCRIH
jgi:hypothetical protein